MAVIEPKGAQASSLGNNAFYFVAGAVVSLMITLCFTATGPSAQGAVVQNDAVAPTPSPVAPSCDGVGRDQQFPHSMKAMYESLLDYQKVLDTTAGDRGAIVGNIAWFPFQMFFYGAHAASPCVKTICEIGFGAGHSTHLYLEVNKQAHLYSFDIHGLGEYQEAGQQWHKNSSHGARFHDVPGSSFDTVPQFAKDHPDIKCDIVHVDGDHSYDAVYKDLHNFKLLAHKNTVILIDDVNEQPSKDAIANVEKEGLTESWYCHAASDTTDQRFASAPGYHKEFCSSRYIWN